LLGTTHDLGHGFINCLIVSAAAIAAALALSVLARRGQTELQIA
jgi:hypothetical protein